MERADSDQGEDTLRNGGLAAFQQYNLDDISGAYDDPSALLDAGENTLQEKRSSVRSRQVLQEEENADTLRGMDDSTFRRFDTSQVAHNKPSAHEYVPPVVQPLEPPTWSDSDTDWSSSTESDNSDAYSEHGAVYQKSVSGSDTIGILGSLCLRRATSVQEIKEQGVFQGLKINQSTGIMPRGLRMTQILESYSPELEDMSVMITRRTDIVPQSPFDFDFTDKANEVIQPDTSSEIDNVYINPVSYIGNIARPLVLPPLDESVSTAEKKRFQVIQHLIESEAGFLTSLKIAVEVYMKPLQALASTSTAVLDTGQISKLFGPVEQILQHHELFYAALCMRVREWTPDKHLADVFISSFKRNEVLKNYTEFVNNFTDAMNILERGINKRQRLTEFLQRQIQKSQTQLSLQALLLKPIQRFPQYILFLKDFIKYTNSEHEDYVILQMAQANIEIVAERLNEAKRQSEQSAIVQYLSSRLEKLPFRLSDSDQVLLRQDSVYWLKRVHGKETQYRKRSLLLFSGSIICAEVKDHRKSWIGGSDQSAGENRLICKWHSSLALLKITDPEYENQSKPFAHPDNEDYDREQSKSDFTAIQKSIYKMDEDFHNLSKIIAHAGSLHSSYMGVDLSKLQSESRILQRELESKRKELQKCEPGRLDLNIPAKNENSTTMFRHTILFQNEQLKQQWMRLLHLAKLRQTKSNTLAWIYEQGEDDEESTDNESFKSGFLYGLPLVVDCQKLTSSSFKLVCAARVGSNTVWFVNASSHSTHIAILSCISPTPTLVETFAITVKKVTCILSTSASKYSNFPKDSKNAVWIGSSFGRLLLYCSETKSLIGTTQLPFAITCIQSYKNRVFVGTMRGQVFVFTRKRGEFWNLEERREIPVSSSSIECFCTVEKKLWIGTGQSCVILSMGSLRLEESVKVATEPGVIVKHLTTSGKGVWITLSQKAIVYLYHCDTVKPLQEIDAKGSLESIVEYSRIKEKFESFENVTVTSLKATTGFLWIGTSVGTVLVYRIPLLKGLPLINGKPFLASDGHKGSVEVVLELSTQLDVSTARHQQFISNEERLNAVPRSDSNVITPTRLQEKLKIRKQNKEGIQIPRKVTAVPLDSVDLSSPPPVSQIIKKMEEDKTMIPLPNIPQISVTTPLASIEEKDAEIETGAADTDKKVDLTQQTSTEQEQEQRTTQEEDDPGNGYEDPSQILDACRENELIDETTEAVYDEVPLDLDISLILDDQENNLPSRRSRAISDLHIHSSRYEVDIQAKESSYAGIYTLEGDTIASYRQQFEPVEGSSFVLTAGAGLMNYRRDESITHSPIVFKRRIQDVSLSEHTSYPPSVLVYEVPLA